jgi:hypothetical protein
VLASHFNPKKILDDFRLLTSRKTEFDKSLTDKFNKQTKNGKDMSKYSALLETSINSVLKKAEEKEIDQLFIGGETSTTTTKISGLEDFELIDFLVIIDGDK